MKNNERTISRIGKQLSDKEMLLVRGGEELRACTGAEHGGGESGGTCNFLMDFEGYLYYDCGNDDYCVAAIA